MTALDANISIIKSGRTPVSRRVLVANGVTVYSGALCSFTAANTTITSVQPCTDDAAANRFAGVADPDDSRNSFPVVGNGSTTYVHIIYDFEMVVLCASVTGAHLGTGIFAADDQTGSPTSSLGPVIGPMREYVDSTHAVIWIGGPVNAASTT